MMNETILNHATDAELVQAAMDNLYALFRAMSHSLPGGELEQGDRLNRHLTFPTNPMFKGVWATRLQPGEVDAALDETIAWFKARGAPFFFWWAGPDAQPDDLGRRLEARGLLSAPPSASSPCSRPAPPAIALPPCGRPKKACPSTGASAFTIPASGSIAFFGATPIDSAFREMTP